MRGGRLCGCGCGASLAGRAPTCRYLNRQHKEQAKDKRLGRGGYTKWADLSPVRKASRQEQHRRWARRQRKVKGPVCRLSARPTVRHWTTGPCGWCGDWFLPTLIVTDPARFCCRDHKLRAHRAKVKQYVAKLKQQRGCAVCGLTEPADQLHWHHLDPETKQADVSRLTSVEAAQAEIAKCIVLCRDHHADLHAGRVTLG